MSLKFVTAGNGSWPIKSSTSLTYHWMICLKIWRRTGGDFARFAWLLWRLYYIDRWQGWETAPARPGSVCRRWTADCTWWETMRPTCSDNELLYRATRLYRFYLGDPSWRKCMGQPKASPFMLCSITKLRASLIDMQKYRMTSTFLQNWLRDRKTGTPSWPKNTFSVTLGNYLLTSKRKSII